MNASCADVVPHWQARQMQDADLDAILAIEASAYQFPWSVGVFRDCLRMKYHCRVAEDRNGQLQGYALMSQGAGEGHILNLCVAGPMQGRGLGRFLLDCLMGIAQQNQLRAVFLEVRPTNPVAIALYHSAGFQQIGIRPNYYPATSGREDAIVLAHFLQ